MSEPGPVFIVGNVKSGTSLLQSLLDGHPELFVLPVELKFFRYTGLPYLSPSNRPLGRVDRWRSPLPAPGPRSPDDVLDDLLATGDLHRFLETGTIPRNLDLRSVAFGGDRFVSALRSRNFASLRELYVGIVECFRESLRVPAARGASRFVEKTPRQEEFAGELHRWFPGARFVHVLRNPYANVHAELLGGRFQRERRHRVYRPLAKSLYQMERNARSLPGYRIVRYEDVVLRPDETLRSLARDLEIAFVDSMLEPTFLGIPWPGNSRSTGGDFRGIDPRPARAFVGEIDPVDVALVNRYFRPTLEKHGYQVLPDPGLRKWLPSLRELPFHYPMNRAMLFTSYL